MAYHFLGYLRMTKKINFIITYAYASKGSKKGLGTT
jgi:hypothetical protein